MSTFINDLLTKLTDRWHEVDLLLARAEVELKEANKELHDALCRASVVLLVAHLEGFLRDHVKAIIADVNKFSSFAKVPRDIQRTFCNSYLPSDHDKEKENAKIEKLITLLSGLDTKLEEAPFLFGGKHDDNRNPAPDVIARIAKNFGIKNIFGLLADSRIDTVFTNSASDTATLMEDLKRHSLDASVQHPYKFDLAKFDFHVVGRTFDKNNRTLWQTFLDNLLTKRNGIAHGSNKLNGDSVGEIREMKTKAIILQYAFAIVVSGKFV